MSIKTAGDTRIRNGALTIGKSSHPAFFSKIPWVQDLDTPNLLFRRNDEWVNLTFFAFFITQVNPSLYILMFENEIGKLSFKDLFFSGRIIKGKVFSYKKINEFIEKPDYIKSRKSKSGFIP